MNAPAPVVPAPARPWWRRRFVGYAAALLLLFALAHLAGARNYVGALSGTGTTSPGAAFLGLAYVLLYLAVVWLVPVLLLAEVLLALVRRLGSSRPRP